MNEAEKLMKEKEAGSVVKFDNTPTPAPAVDPAAPLGYSEDAKNQMAGHTAAMDMVDIGWKPILMETLPSQGMFYPDGATLSIKAADVGEVRHFSSIDEGDPLDMDDKLNMVMDKCLKLNFPNTRASWKDLKEEDRFWLVFAIRELTFKNGENKLFVNVKCGIRCAGDGSFVEKVEMSKDNFDYYKINPKLMRYYSDSEKCFIITDRQINNPGNTIKLYVPSLGVTTFIKNFIRDKNQRGDFYDKAFLKFAPFMFNDWRTMSEASYIKTQQDGLGWNQFTIALMVQAVEMIRFGVKTEIKRSCTQCGVEVAAPLSFQGGVRSLFLISDPFGELS